MNAADHDREAIEAAAAEWLARRDRRFTAEEAVAFARWRLADPRRQAAVEELELVWGALDELSADVSQQRAGGVGVALPAPMTPLAPPAARAVEPRRRGRWWPVVGLAAAVALVAGGVFWRGGADEAEPARRYETLVGMQRTVELTDGSELRLNTNTAVLVEFSRRMRHVTLERGEVFCGVAKDAQRPFVVRVSEAEARVLGTAFAVRLRDSSRETEVLVAEGRVSFGRGGTTSVNPTLEAGQRGVLAWEGARPLQISALGDAEISRRLAWQTGRLVFVNIPLADAVAEMNRYQRQQIVVDRAALVEEPVGGTFKIGNSEGFVNFLETSLQLTVAQRDADKIVLVRRP